jgi:Tol biopolymer transport system component
MHANHRNGERTWAKPVVLASWVLLCNLIHTSLLLAGESPQRIVIFGSVQRGRGIVFAAQEDFSRAGRPPKTGYDIYRVSRSGDEVIRLTNHERCVPAGDVSAFDEIACIKVRRELDSQIDVLDVSGRVLRSVPRPVRTSYFFPLWSPDGKRLLFTAFDESQEWNPSLWVIERNGSGLRRLAGFDLGSLARTWSADSESVVYVAPEALSFCRVAMDGKPGNVELPDMKLHPSLIDLSPRGSHMAISYFLRDRLQVVSLPTGKAQQVETVEGMPRWSPDGKALLYIRMADGVLQLFRLDVSSGNSTQLTHGKEGVCDSVWTERGEVFFVRQGDSGRNIWRIREDGTGETLIFPRARQEQQEE